MSNDLRTRLERLRDEMQVEAINNAKNMDDLFADGANAFIPMIVELATALDVIRENGEIAPPNADTMVARLALAKLERKLEERVDAMIHKYLFTFQI